jgi:glutamyl-tRNA synthetase
LQQSSFAGKKFSDEYLLAVIAAMRDRASFVKDFVEKCPYFFSEPTQYDPEVVKKRWKPESRQCLLALADEFGKLEYPTKEEYENALHKTAESLKVGNGQLIHPLRLAVSGMGVGPGLFDILAILGKDEAVRRMRLAIERIA